MALIPGGIRTAVAAGIVSAVIVSGCSTTKSPAELGSLVVSSTGQAAVAIDGKAAGNTNQELKAIPEGVHELTVSKNGQVFYNGKVNVRPGTTTSISVGDSGSSYEAVADDSADEAQNRLLDSVSLSDPAEESDLSPGFSYDSRGSSVTSDFSERDRLPQTTVPRSRWYDYGSWGPPAAKYPAPDISGSASVTWKRNRIVAVAKKYLNLPYKHVHIPAMGGLDCSNYTAWVYNYGLGIKFTSAVADQGATVGRRVSKSSLQPGDLLYFRTDGAIVHTGIYLGSNMMIDCSTMNSARGKVAIKRFDTGWPSRNFAYAKRIIG